MKRFGCNALREISTMANLPPRKVSSSNKSSKPLINVTTKQDSSALQILLQMGFMKQRALKALAATGNRSVQLASDWLLTHVNDAFIDANEPREYIFYASPTGPILTQLFEFWEKSKDLCGWNGAHSFPPHITLVSFFKAPDEKSLQLAKAMKHVVENVGLPPSCPLKLESYISHNFMGLFVSEEHAEYFKKIAVQYVKQVSSILGVKVDTYEQLNKLGTCFPWCTTLQEKPIKSVNLEPQVKSLHITLAYHFDAPAYEGLKLLVNDLQPLECSEWELRLYSRDPRFADYQVYKVTQGYTPEASDELELVLGDYIYVEEKEVANTPDGWVHGTSWLTGVSGYLPAVYTQRTAESDAWTLHRAMSLGNNSSDSKSESDSNTETDMSGPSTPGLGHEKSEESYREWEKYWTTVVNNKDGMSNIIQGQNIDWKSNNNPKQKEEPVERTAKEPEQETTMTSKSEEGRRWIFSMRHGERVDLTYGQWVTHCFDENDKYVRKDLNMPLKLAERAGGKDSYSKDSPLTRVGRFQAQLVGEGLRLAGVTVKHVYASAALRCVETAHEFLTGLQADPSVKIRVDPGLFEYKLWHLAKGMAPFMTPAELHKAGYNVDLNYKPYVDIDIDSDETVEEFYKRNEFVMQSAYSDTANEGGNILFVGHAATLDLLALSFNRLNDTAKELKPYQISKHLLRVPYCAFAAMKDKPFELVAPPCPPSINSSSGRFDWKILLDLIM